MDIPGNLSKQQRVGGVRENLAFIYLFFQFNRPLPLLPQRSGSVQICILFYFNIEMGKFASWDYRFQNSSNNMTSLVLIPFLLLKNISILPALPKDGWN